MTESRERVEKIVRKDSALSFIKLDSEGDYSPFETIRIAT